MNSSDVISRIEGISSKLEAVKELAQLQTELLSTGAMAMLDTTFQKRKCLFDALLAEWNGVNTLLDEHPDLAANRNVVDCYTDMKTKAGKVMETDHEVSLLLAKHSDELLTHLLQLLRTRSTAQDYKRVEQVTGAIAKLFPGNARRFDTRL